MSKLKALLGGVPVGDEYPVRIMAVLNLSPESFYKESVAVVNAVDRAQALEKHADFIDVGAMSTAPYLNAWIPPEKELERLKAVLPEIVKNVKVPVSVDTYRPQVAEYALRAGAAIINDVTGGKLYPEMCKIVADYGASVVLMARERQPRQGVDPVIRVIDALAESITYFEKCGVDGGKIVVDPGIGFPVLPPRDEPYVIRGEYRHGDPQWPWWKWDLHLIKNLPKLRELGKPILVGVSRKSFLRKIAGVEKPEEVLPASLAAEALAVYHGAHVVRTHNPQETRQAVKIAESLRSVHLA
ncbi:dihydropteroate synthase [Pyrobaculum aerophilum]|uniref:Dihydropteroate synthase n=3 Tax=Pyrobaculum aerophilum TaxID=13773 RepID=Q8ZU59_PYRAE|nr:MULTISPECIES: dihydropteroate synthase [Pyrobaculum]AAL64549.1 dihydropteroate synthase [Pyrobaculum aerophilum str. IM2]MCX8136059.1 dihydropteroate synthase [Pyrobaculum aerophilum]HII47392.1 dihydropteroate synthase [Pyrobaculum aerophilum]